MILLSILKNILLFKIILKRYSLIERVKRFEINKKLTLYMNKPKK